MMMPGREYQAQPSRFGFNGKENDNDVKGFGNQYDYGFRIYDSRIGKFLSADPLMKSYPWFTPYQFASNTPLQAVDLDGKEGETYLETMKIDGKETVLRRVVELDIYVKVSEVEGSRDFRINSFAPKDLNKFSSDFRNDLAKHYKDGKFKDKDGNPVVFKFNIRPFGGDESAFRGYRNALEADEVGVLKDGEGFRIGTRTLIMQQTRLSEINIPKDAEASFPPGELGEFRDPSTVNINDQQYDNEDRTYTIAHEVGHFLLSRHPDLEIRRMGNSAEKHDKAGKGILHYYPVLFTFYTNQINPGQANKRIMTTPGRESVNQLNVIEFLKSIIDTGKRDVTPPPQPPKK